MRLAPWSPGKATQAALWVALIYALAGALWILFSDRALSFFANDAEKLTWLQTLKGWFFVAATAALVFWLARKSLQATEEARQELFESERNYRALTENSPGAGLFLFDRDLRFVLAAGAGLFRVGLSGRKMTGRTLMDIFPPDLCRTIEPHMRAALEGLEDRFQVLFNQRHFEVNIAPRLDRDGGVIGGVASALDITERYQQERALAVRERNLRLLTDNLPDLIMRVDRDLRYVYVNPSLCITQERPEDDFIGRTCRQSGQPERACRYWEEVIREVFETGQMQHVQAKIPTNRGEVFYDAILIPERDEGGRVGTVLVSARDISMLKRGEEERLKVESQLQHVQKLESLGVLAGGIAHDFNNLLMGVLGNASLAAMELPEQSPAREYLGQIEKTANRLADLTNQLLAYSGRGKFLTAKADLSALVRDLTDLLKTVISKKAFLRYQLAEQLPPVELDLTQARQVILNLLTNASDALEDQVGTVTITTGTAHFGPDYLQEAFLADDIAPGPYVFLEVSDTGCGMSKEETARIFDPFYTTKFAGRGLGLAAVSGIVRGHGGAIKVYSEPGQGTSIKAIFPAAEGPAAAPRPKAEENSLPRGTSVLVVDDEEMVRGYTKEALTRFGCRVLLASDGVEALELFRRDPGQIDMVLLDLTMPRMNGEETFRELKRVNPRVKVLLSSGYNQSDVTNRFAGKGLAGFIQKPYSPLDLRDKMAQVLQD